MCLNMHGLLLWFLTTLTKKRAITEEDREEDHG